jgi:hypothetical protein
MPEIARVSERMDEKQPQILRLRRCKERTSFAQDDNIIHFQSLTAILCVDTT